MKSLREFELPAKEQIEESAHPDTIGGGKVVGVWQHNPHKDYKGPKVSDRILVKHADGHHTIHADNDQYSQVGTHKDLHGAMNQLKATHKPKLPGVQKEEVELTEAVYQVKHDGVPSDHSDKDLVSLFSGKKDVINHTTKYEKSAADTAKMLKGKGFNNVRVYKNGKLMEEVESLDEKWSVDLNDNSIHTTVNGDKWSIHKEKLDDPLTLRKNGKHHVTLHKKGAAFKGEALAHIKSHYASSKSKNEAVEYIEESLTKSDPIEKWISDFVNSDNPKFAGKSKKERIKMAQGAYYGAQNESTKEQEVIEESKKPSVGSKVTVDTAQGTKPGVVKQVTDSHIFVQHPNIKGTIGYHHEYVKLDEETEQVEESRAHKILAAAMRAKETRDSFASGQSRIPTPAERKAQDVPFDADENPKDDVVVGKRGKGAAKASHLAHLGLKGVTKEETELAESVEQLDEIDNGPGKVKNIPKVNYGVARDAAKIDYTLNTSDIAAANRKKIEDLKRAHKQAVADKQRELRVSDRNQRKMAEKADLHRVMMDIDAAIGNAFPDGDPMDVLLRKYKDHYGSLDIDLLDKAVRNAKVGKNYHDYVAKVWDQHMGDNPEHGGNNPWR